LHHVEAALSALKGATDESCGGKQLKFGEEEILPECSLFPPEGLSLFYIKRRETPSIHRGESVSPLYREDRERLLLFKGERSSLCPIDL